MEENFKLVPRIRMGARVKIKPDTRFYTGGPRSSNPKDIPGSIVEGESNWIHVQWDNGTRNSYEEHELIFEEANEMMEVDVNKLYFEENVVFSNIDQLLRHLYPKGDGAVATFYYVPAIEEYAQQCQKNRMRSFDDILFLANNYLPELSVKDIFIGLLMFNVKEEDVANGRIPKSFSNCSTMQRIRYTNSWHNFEGILYSMNCNKYESIYSWKELFKMIGVETAQDLKDWYQKQFEVKQV